MASTRTRIKPIRISNETADYFEGKPLNRMVEGLCELMQGGKIEYDGENLRVKGVYTEKTEESDLAKWGIKEEWLEGLDTMSRFMGGTVGEMIRLFDEAVNEGMLTVSGGRYVGIDPNLYTERFKEVCHDINKDPQEVMDKVVGMLEKGKI